MKHHIGEQFCSNYMLNSREILISLSLAAFGTTSDPDVWGKVLWSISVVRALAPRAPTELSAVWSFPWPTHLSVPQHASLESVSNVVSSSAHFYCGYSYRSGFVSKTQQAYWNRIARFLSSNYSWLYEQIWDSKNIRNILTRTNGDSKQNYKSDEQKWNNCCKVNIILTRHQSRPLGEELEDKNS